MMPSDQCFHTDDFAGEQIDLRLIEECKFLSIKSSGEYPGIFPEIIGWIVGNRYSQLRTLPSV